MKSVAPVEKKIEKKKKKKEILKKENWRAKLWMFFLFFFFYLRDRLRQKAGTSAVGSAFDFCSSKFSLDVFVERAFFFFFGVFSINSQRFT